MMHILWVTPFGHWVWAWDERVKQYIPQVYDEGVAYVKRKIREHEERNE